MHFFHSPNPNASVLQVFANADIAILDQNLEYASVTVLGTDIIAALVADGFKGLLCIRSANGAEEDVQQYLQSGAHCFLDKAMSPKATVQTIVAAYVHHHGLPPSRSKDLLQAGPSQGTRSQSRLSQCHMFQDEEVPCITPPPGLRGEAWGPIAPVPGATHDRA